MLPLNPTLLDPLLILPSADAAGYKDALGTTFIGVEYRATWFEIGGFIPGKRLCGTQAIRVCTRYFYHEYYLADLLHVVA